MSEENEISIRKNVAFSTLRNISNVLSNKEYSFQDINVDSTHVKYYLHAPLVSSYVEHSFSAYKSSVTDDRRSFFMQMSVCCLLFTATTHGIHNYIVHEIL